MSIPEVIRHEFLPNDETLANAALHPSRGRWRGIVVGCTLWLIAIPENSLAKAKANDCKGGDNAEYQ